MINNGEELIDYIVEELRDKDILCYDSAIVEYLRNMNYLEWQRLFGNEGKDNE